MKNFFPTVLIILLPPLVFLTWEACLEVFNYQKLKIKVPIEVTDWRIDQKKKNKFKVLASYQYQFKDKFFQNKQSFKINFSSSSAALLYLKQQSNKDLYVWIDPIIPKKSSLEKKFPTKQIINAILVIAFFMYFLLSKAYLYRKFPE